MTRSSDSSVCTIGLNACLEQDQELVEASRQGDAAAFEALYTSHQRRAYVLAYRWCGRSHHDAAEVVADAFLSIYRILCMQGRPIERFDSYLYTVVRRRSYRLVQARAGIPVPVVEGALANLASQPDDALDDLIAEALIAAFRQLSARHQQVLLMSEVDGRTATDVASFFGITNQAAAALKYRATRNLRAAFLMMRAAPDGRSA